MGRERVQDLKIDRDTKQAGAHAQSRWRSSTVGTGFDKNKGKIEQPETHAYLHQVASGLDKRKQTEILARSDRVQVGAASKASGLNKQHAGDQVTGVGQEEQERFRVEQEETNRDTRTLRQGPSGSSKQSVRVQQAACRRPGDRINKKGARGLDMQQGHEQGYSHAQAGSK